MKNEKNGHRQYLEGLGRGPRVSNQTIADFTKNETGMSLVGKKRVTAGEVNEVYELELENKSRLILRISPNGFPNFQQEKWAIDQCRVIKVPVPNIITINYVDIDGKERGFCLMDRVDGEVLERGPINFRGLDINQQRDYLIQAGGLLSRIHTVSAPGFGRVINDEETQFDHPDQMFPRLLDKGDMYERVATEVDMPISVVRSAMKIIERFKAYYSSLSPRLNHGDFFLRHLMVKGNSIVSILDWAEVRIDTPVYDFANWAFWSSRPETLEWIKEGYENKDLFDSDFVDILHFIKIMIGLDVLEWYHGEKYPEMVEKTKLKLANDVDHFK